MAKTYAAQVKDFNAKARRNMSSIMKTSIQEVMNDAQTPVAKGGNMPVDVGNLRNSLASGLNGSIGAPGPDSYTLTIAQMDLGDAAKFSWTAEYARRRHYGFKGVDSLGRTFDETGTLWRDKAAQKWQSTVAMVAKRFS